MRYPDRENLTGYLRDLDRRLTRQRRHGHGSATLAAAVAELRQEVAELRAEMEMLKRGPPSGQTRRD
jgi:hypothetical protein